LTGGPSGLVGINKLSILGVELDNENKFYIFLATVFVFFSLALELFDKSYLSYKLKFIKESESASESFGIDASKFKLKLLWQCHVSHLLWEASMPFIQVLSVQLSFDMKYSIDSVCYGLLLEVLEVLLVVP